MSEIILIILCIAAIIVIYLLLKTGRKEFKPRLPHRERGTLEKTLEKEKDTKEMEKEAQTRIRKYPYSLKDIKEELVKYRSFFDIDHDKLTTAIRSGIEKCVVNDYKEALENFTTAIDIKPEEPVGHYCRAITKLKLRNYESSIPDFTESIRLQMKELNALYYRGIARYHVKDYNGAIIDLTSYLKAVPDFAEVYYTLGLVYKDSNQDNKALENFSKAVAYNDMHEAAFFERAMIKNKLGDRGGCCIDLQKAFDLGHLEAYHYIKELCKETTQPEQN